MNLINIYIASVSFIFSIATATHLAFAQAQQSNSATPNVQQRQTGGGSGIAADAEIIVDEKLEAFKDNAEGRVRNRLETQFGGAKFAVLVDLVFNAPSFVADAGRAANPVQLRSLAKRLENSDMQRVFAESLNLTTIRKYISRITVTVTTGEAISESQKKVLASIVTSTLKIPEAAVNISTESLELPSVIEKYEEVKKQAETVQREKEAIQQESRQSEIKTRIEAQKVLQEKTKLELLVQQLQAENAESLERVEAANQKISALEQELSVYQTPLGEIKKIVKGLEVPLLVLPFVLVALAVTLVLSLLYSRISKEKTKRLYEGIEVVSQALGKIGAKNGAGAFATGGINQSSQNSGSTALTLARSEDGLKRSERSQEFKALSEHELKALVQESREAWESCKGFEFLLMSELKEWANESFSSKLRLVNLLSVLPASECTRVVSLLSTEDIASLQDVFHEALDKQIGHRVCIALFRQLMVTSLSLPVALQKMTDLTIVQATDMQLAQLVLEAPQNVAALILSLLPQARFLRLSAILQNLRPSLELDQIFAKMTAVLEDPDTLAELTSSLRLWGKQLKNSDNRVRQHVSQLLTDSQARASAELRSRIQSAFVLDPALTSEAATHQLSIGDFMQLEQEVIRELLDPFDSESLAKLFIGIDAELVQRLAQALSYKTRIAAELEYKRLSASELSRKRALKVSKQLQEELIAGLKDLVEQGVVEINRAEASSRRQPLPRGTAAQIGETSDSEEKLQVS